MWEMVRGVHSLEIYSSDKLVCGQVCLQNQTIFNSPTELKRNTIKGGRHKKAAAKMAEDGNSDIKRKSKGFLQSNSAQMDSAWTLLLHSIKFIKTGSSREREAVTERERERGRLAEEEGARERAVVF